jgi:hypothetical protein
MEDTHGGTVIGVWLASTVVLTAYHGPYKKLITIRFTVSGLRAYDAQDCSIVERSWRKSKKCPRRKC